MKAVAVGNTMSQIINAATATATEVPRGTAQGSEMLPTYNVQSHCHRLRSPSSRNQA